MSITMTGDTSR